MLKSRVETLRCRIGCLKNFIISFGLLLYDRRPIQIHRTIFVLALYLSLKQVRTQGFLSSEPLPIAGVGALSTMSEGAPTGFSRPSLSRLRAAIPSIMSKPRSRIRKASLLINRD
ncbi:hypothetical protein ABKV19_020673 [Rosa sericea]